MYTTDSEWANVINYKHYRKIEDEKAKRPLVGFEPSRVDYSTAPSVPAFLGLSFVLIGSVSPETA